jgi:hypothetical protein
MRSTGWQDLAFGQACAAPGAAASRTTSASPLFASAPSPWAEGRCRHEYYLLDELLKKALDEGFDMAEVYASKADTFT